MQTRDLGAAAVGAVIGLAGGMTGSKAIPQRVEVSSNDLERMAYYYDADGTGEIDICRETVRQMRKRAGVAAQANRLLAERVVACESLAEPELDPPADG